MRRLRFLSGFGVFWSVCTVLPITTPPLFHSLLHSQLSAPIPSAAPGDLMVLPSPLVARVTARVSLMQMLPPGSLPCLSRRHSRVFTFPRPGSLLVSLLPAQELPSLLSTPGSAAAGRRRDLLCLQGGISSLWAKWVQCKSPCIIFPCFFAFSFWLWSFLSWSAASFHSLKVAVMRRNRTLEWYMCSRGKTFFVCFSEWVLWINSISSVRDIGKWILAVLLRTFTQSFCQALTQNWINLTRGHLWIQVWKFRLFGNFVKEFDCFLSRSKQISNHLRVQPKKQKFQVLHACLR